MSIETILLIVLGIVFSVVVILWVEGIDFMNKNLWINIYIPSAIFLTCIWDIINLLKLLDLFLMKILNKL